jgi:hypothetical protein
MAWEISLHHEVEEWYLALCKSDPETADLVEHAIDQLAADGPALRRPLVLVAGDKAGNWDRWYDQAVPLADQRYTDHLNELKQQEEQR